jgi:hypothetical protein
MFQDGWNIGLVNFTLKNVDPIKISIEKTGETEINIVRIAACNPEGNKKNTSYTAQA